MDTPIFLDVSSVTASYGVGASVGANTNLNTSDVAVTGTSVNGCANWSSSPMVK